MWSQSRSCSFELARGHSGDMGKTKRKRRSNQRFDPTCKIEGLQSQRVSGDAVIPALSKVRPLL